MANKATIQVYSEVFWADRFSDYGVCESVSDDVEALRSILHDLVEGTRKPRPFPESYIKCEPDPAGRLLEFLIRLHRVLRFLLTTHERGNNGPLSLSARFAVGSI